jgi:hypothetical protein
MRGLVMQKSKYIWTAYCVGILVLGATILIDKIIIGGFFQFKIYVPFLIEVLLMMCVFFLIYGIPLWPKIIWKILCIALFLWLLGLGAIAAYIGFFNIISNWQAVGLLLLTIILLLPAQYKLYLYAFRDKNMWKKQEYLAPTYSEK